MLNFSVEKSRSPASVLCISCHPKIHSQELYASSTTNTDTHAHTHIPWFTPFYDTVFHYPKNYLLSIFSDFAPATPFSQNVSFSPFSCCWGSQFKWHCLCDTFPNPSRQGDTFPLLTSIALFILLLLLSLNHVKLIHMASSYHEYRDINSCFSLYKILISTLAFVRASDYFI